MSAAELMVLAGKDYFREPEAAEYCGLSVDEFRNWYPAAGITPRRVGAGTRGRKLYSRADLASAIERSPEWQPSTGAATPSISTGPKVGSNSADLSERLRPVRRRGFVARKKPS